MKKTKLLTTLAALGLVFSLGACQTGDVIINVGDVEIGGDSEESETTSEGSIPSETTSEGSSPNESTSEGSSLSESASEGTSPSEPSSEDSSPSESTGGETTGSEDTGSSYVPGASAISYEVKIVSENTSLTQYDSMTLDVELYMYEYKEGEPTPTLISTTKSSEVSDGVSLTVDNEAIIGIEGLVITALEAGSANITAHWNVDDYIYDSDPVEFSVSEYIPTYTYEAKITSDLSEIEIGEHLVEVYLYTYADGEMVNPDGVKASEGDVTLTSGDSSIIETTDGSLTIKAVSLGSTTLTATWIGHIEATDTINVTVKSSTPEPEPEPEDVYTYEVKIENKDAYTNVLAGYEHEEEDIPALKIGLYTYKNSEQEGVVYPTTTDEVSDLELTSSNSSLVSVNSDLTLDIKVDTELTTPVTITATWTGHYTDESESNVASDSVDVYISYTPYPVYIESISFTQSEYVLYYGGNEGESSTTVGVTYSPEVVDDSSYSINVENSSVATFDKDTMTLTAVGVGETTMTVSATYGGATGTATVKVVQGKTDLTSISLSSNTYNLAYNDGYGSFTIGVGSDTSDIKVTLNPENPDYKQLSVTNDEGYLDVKETTTNMFVISVTDSAKEVLKDNSITTELTIASTYYSEVQAQTLTVTIEQTPAEIAHPVLGIELTGSVNSVDEGYTASMQYNGTLTLGGENGDIAVSILPENAYSTAWSAEVSTKDSSSTYISLNGDATNGYTITPINGEALTEDIDATVIISSEGIGSDGNKLSVELTITIIHQESYPVSLSVSGFNSEINLISITGTETINVTSIVKDQRDNDMEGLGLSATVDNDTDNTEVTITPTTTEGEFVIDAGSTEGSATISFYLTDYTAIKASETITVTVTDQYHEISTVSYTGGDQTLDIDLGADTVYGSFTVTDDMVNFSNATEDVDPSDIAQGFSLYTTDTTYVSIDNDTNTITAINGTSEGVDVTIYIYSVAAPSVYTTFTVTVKDVTDYSVQSLTLVDEQGNDLESVELKVSASEGSSNNTLESLGIYVSIKPDYATEKDYDVTISDSEDVTYSDGYISAAASKDDYSATLTVTSKDNGDASDSLTINVVTTYVKADVITIDDGIPTTMTEGDTIDLDQYVTISSSSSLDPTDQSYTVTSSNEAISVSNHTLTAVSATDDDITITITSADASTTITFNGVKAKDKTITLSFIFYANDSSTRLTVPEGMNAYLVGDWAKTGSDWTLGTDYKLTAVADGGDGNYVYQYTFEDGLTEGDYWYQILVARDGEELSYAHALASGMQFSITSADYGTTKDISYVIDYESIGAADPEIDTEKTVDVYFLVFDNWGDGFASKVTTLASDSAIFGGNTTCGVTTGSTSHGNTQYYMYNSVKGTANPGLSDWFTFHNGSWGNQVALGTIAIPDVEDGCVAIYVVDTSTSSSNEYAWGTPWVATSGLPNDAQMTNGWCTNYTSVAAFINNCTGWVS